MSPKSKTYQIFWCNKQNQLSNKSSDSTKKSTWISNDSIQEKPLKIFDLIWFDQKYLIRTNILNLIKNTIQPKKINSTSKNISHLIILYSTGLNRQFTVWFLTSGIWPISKPIQFPNLMIKIWFLSKCRRISLHWSYNWIVLSLKKWNLNPLNMLRDNSKLR